MIIRNILCNGMLYANTMHVQASTFGAYILPDEPVDLLTDQAAIQNKVQSKNEFNCFIFFQLLPYPIESTNCLYLYFLYSSLRLSYLFFLFIVSFNNNNNKKTYVWTKKENWTKINTNGNNVPYVNPVPFTDRNKDLSFNITPTEVESMNDASIYIYIRFHKVREFTLPRFNDTVEGQKSFWKWQAVRMRNFINYLILHPGFKSKYCNPVGDKKNVLKVILDNHVARFYRLMVPKIWSNNTSIAICFLCMSYWMLSLQPRKPCHKLPTQICVSACTLLMIGRQALIERRMDTIVMQK